MVCRSPQLESPIVCSDYATNSPTAEWACRWPSCLSETHALATVLKLKKCSRCRQRVHVGSCPRGVGSCRDVRMRHPGVRGDLDLPRNCRSRGSESGGGVDGVV